MLSPVKKRRVTLSNYSFNSDDDGDPPAICDVTAKVSIVSFTNPCCDNHIKGKRGCIQICSERVFFRDGADTCSLMKEKN
jgi:hypothetical protein